MEGNLSTEIPQNYYKAFAIGFLTNALNPKATLFFLALFTTAIPASTSLYTKAAYGMIGIGLVLLLIFALRMGSGYFDYIKKIKSWVKSQV